MKNDQFDLFRSLKTFQLMTVAAMGEGRGEVVEGRIAICCVIRNRVNAKSWYGNTYHEVILKDKQFSCFNEDDPNLEYCVSLARMITASADPVVRETKLIALGVISDVIQDRTKGATHYFSLLGKKPKWVATMKLKGLIGDHAFYKEERA